MNPAAPQTLALDPADLAFRHRERVPALARAFRDSGLPTPSFVHDEAAFRRNARVLRAVQERSGAKILLAQKAFSAFPLYPLVRDQLAGTAASGLHEARLGAEEFGGEVHVYSPAFKPEEIAALLEFADHLVFNSLGQWRRYRGQVLACPRPVSPGLRINPERSQAAAGIYDPCAPGSRFGVLASQLAQAPGEDLAGIEGLHFHALCEQGADALEQVMEAVTGRFDAPLRRMRWLNLGGGHLITSPGYDLERLLRVIAGVRRRYPGLEIYLEPGEAIAIGGGILAGSVIDVIENGMPVAVLDVSATAHMPDTLEMPYRPDIEGAALPGEKPFTCRLGGPTCLAGDVIGDYSFDRPLQIGDQVYFHDMAHYTVVKTTTFNGVPLPSLTLCREDGSVELLRAFGYEDFKSRLG